MAIGPLSVTVMNKATPFLHHPLPRQNELMDNLGKAVLFSKIDFRSGFHQVPLWLEDRPKPAFRLRGQLYQYNRMPFGLKNACQQFARMMDYELQTRGMDSFAICYVDDILIYSSSCLLSTSFICKHCSTCATIAVLGSTLPSVFLGRTQLSF